MTAPVAAAPVVDVEFDFAEEDARAVVRALLWRQFTSTPLLVVAGLVAAGFVVGTGWGAGGWALAVAAIIAAVGLTVVGGVLGVGSSIARMREVPGTFGRRHVIAAESGLTVRTGGGTLDVSWGATTGVSEAAGYVLIEQSSTVVHPVPASAVEDVAAFRVLVDGWRADGPPIGTGDTEPAAASADGPVPWSGRRALLAAVAILAVDRLLAAGSYLISEGLGDLYFAFGSLVVLCGGVWLAVRRWGPAGVRGVLGRPATWADVGAGLVVGALVLAADALVFSLAEVVLGEEVWGNSQGWIDAAMLAAPLTTIVAVVLTGPVSEEVLFRGLLFRGLRRRWGVVIAALTSAAVFAAVHPEDLSAASIALMASTFVTGLLLAGATVWRGTLVTAIVAHVLINGVATALNAGGGMPWVIPAGPESPLVAYDLAIGDCARGFPDEPPDARTSPTRIAEDAIPCEQRHDVEVYDVWSPDRPTMFPGHDELALEADERCYERFTGYVGRDYADSELDYLAVVPDEAAWGAGRQESRCLLIHLDREPLIGSARDSGW